MNHEKRTIEFYVLAAFFMLFVLFLYGPLSAILILSFQGETGGLTFPLNGVSLHWFANLFERQAVGDFGGSFKRSLVLGIMVMIVTVAVSLLAGLAFRRKFRGATALFYLAVASLVVPSIIISLGIGVVFQQIGLRPAWYTSAFGAHLTWT
ncbi:ABC transporter permease, partial [Mesorhizobium sp.]|uniref:ABC transporter permease n=1 Tax=Mesorhizobium sp. TaxID=1871066 RepID=UPI00345D8473